MGRTAHRLLDDPERPKEQFERLFEKREEVRRVEGGLAVRFPGRTRFAKQALDFATRELKCCPFLTFHIAIAPEGGVWIYMGGDEEVEDYITSAFDHTWT